jgi:hypothetical protein
MSYVPPFESLKQKFRIIGANGRGRIDIKYADFIDLLKLMLRAVAVDEDWYRRSYPDVADAIKAGTYKSAKHHFVEDGYFEGRAPCEFSVDEAWYASAYPDIATGMKAGTIRSGKEHFISHGYKEGRLPAEY